MLPHPGFFRVFLACIASLLVGCPAVLHADDVARTGGPYVPTPQHVVDEMLKLADVRPQDFVIDLGSGDGRIVLTAARRYSAHGMGFDIDEDLVAQSNEKARDEGLEGRVTFRVQDVMTAPLGEATVLTLYLLPGMNKMLQPRLLHELKPGARIVAHDFDLGDWKPDRQINVDLEEKYGTRGSWKSTIYYWVVPAFAEGVWRITMPDAGRAQWRLQLRQHFQELEAVAYADGRRRAVTGAQLEGTRIRFRIPGGSNRRARSFEGIVDGERMQGTAETRDGTVPWTAVREAAVLPRAPATSLR